MIGLEPVLAMFGDLALRWSGLLAGLALLLGSVALWRAAARGEVPKPVVTTALAWGVPAGILGARAASAAAAWDYILVNPLALRSSQVSTLLLWGGLVSGGLVVALRLRDVQDARLTLAEAGTAPLAVGIALASLGAMLSGEGLGQPTGATWGVSYASPLAATPDMGTPRHPAAAYEGGAALAALGLAWFTASPGRRAWVFLAAFGTASVMLGPVRLEPPFAAGWQVSQLLAGGTTLFALGQLARGLALPARPWRAARASSP